MPIDLAAEQRAALVSAWHLQRTGNFVAAFDLAQDGLLRWPDSLALQYVSILALASCGSTQAAVDAFRASILRADPSEDYLALEARLFKDLAFNGRENTGAALTRAAWAYEHIAQRTGGTYSCQNAALLWTLAGETDRAGRLAASVRDRITDAAVPQDELAAYFHWATLAEAALVLGELPTLDRAVAAANPLCRQNLWARSRTLLQMRRLSGLRPECADTIERWYRPGVGMVLGPEWQPAGFQGAVRLNESDLPALAYCIGSTLNSETDELSAQGIALHAIFPNSLIDEPRTSETRPPASPNASGHCNAYTWSSLLLDESDDHDRVCAETALGLSLSHADALSAPWIVLARADGRWYALRDADRNSVRAEVLARGQRQEQRSRYAFLFADAVSYSSLTAAETTHYWTHLLPTTAAVLRRRSNSIVLRKTWGDAVHAVFSSAKDAAEAAMEIQANNAQLIEELAPGRRLAFRIALHFGAADDGFDPVEEARSIFGPQLSFAARIVPVAPPGGVFVTERFAAQLSLEGAERLGCSYVGTTSLAKSFGRVRLLTLAEKLRLLPA